MIYFSRSIIEKDGNLFFSFDPTKGDFQGRGARCMQLA